MGVAISSPDGTGGSVSTPAAIVSFGTVCGSGLANGCFDGVVANGADPLNVLFLVVEGG
jgi:hypothetical protein